MVFLKAPADLGLFHLWWRYIAGAGDSFSSLAMLKSCSKRHASPVQDPTALWMDFLLERRDRRFATVYPLHPHFKLSCVHRRNCF
jgi:hypothetical protein